MSRPPFILVHGAWHSGACWKLIAPLLTGHGHIVIAPDLPGHGSSSLPLHKVSMKHYVNALVDLLDELEQPAVLVGHSMAGMVISEAAGRRPDRVAQLIYLCAYLPRDGESVFDLIALNRGGEPASPIELALHMSEDKRSCSVQADEIVPLFYPLASAEISRQARSAFAVQATLPLAARVSIDRHSFDRVPRTYISCTEDKVIPLQHQRRMLARQRCDTLLQLEADHSPFYSCPEQLAALLLASAAA